MDIINNDKERRSTYNIEFIKNTILEIKKELNKLEENCITNTLEKELKIMEKFSDFYTNYPFLVKRICKNQSLAMIYKMLNILDKVENGNDTIENTELKLGNELAEKYLYPKIKK